MPVHWGGRIRLGIRVFTVHGGPQQLLQAVVTASVKPAAAPMLWICAWACACLELRVAGKRRWETELSMQGTLGWLSTLHGQAPVPAVLTKSCVLAGPPAARLPCPAPPAAAGPPSAARCAACWTPAQGPARRRCCRDNVRLASLRPSICLGAASIAATGTRCACVVSGGGLVQRRRPCAERAAVGRRIVMHGTDVT
jgi:hypothetical protein